MSLITNFCSYFIIFDNMLTNYLSTIGDYGEII